MRTAHLAARTGITAVALAVAGCNAVLGIEDVSLARPDAGGSRPSVPTSQCAVDPNFGLVVSNDVTTKLTRRPSDGVPVLIFLLDVEPRTDGLGVLLFDNMGGHGKLETPGTYALTDSDSRKASCGICVVIEADIDPSTSKSSQTYFALGQGTLQLDKADATQLAGRMLGLKLRHVDLTGDSTREINDGCTVTIDHVEFDVMYSPPSTVAAIGTAAMRAH